MSIKSYTQIILFFTTVIISVSSFSLEANQTGEISLTNLLSQSSTFRKNTDIIIDHVIFPANTEISKRWHPGDLFVYVENGSIVVQFDNEEKITGNAGALISIPYKKTYKAYSKSEGAKMVLFRVHETGKDIRTKVQ